MRTAAISRNRDLAIAAERQMRTWALQMESQRRLEERAEAAAPRPMIHPYVALSRETGVDAGDFAKSVAAGLGWKLLDRELLDYMADRQHWSQVALEYVDERTASWFHETFGKWLDEQVVSQAEFVSSLGKLVLMAAQHENTVFVGRGAQFFLPREDGLLVRVIAPVEVRIKCIMARRQCSPHEAEKYIQETDTGRADFVRRYFHRDVADARLYDLVINLEHCARDVARDLILSACQRRFGPSA